jgi:hypothetical protein
MSGRVHSSRVPHNRRRGNDIPRSLHRVHRGGKDERDAVLAAQAFSDREDVALVLLLLLFSVFGVQQFIDLTYRPLRLAFDVPFVLGAAEVALA